MLGVRVLSQENREIFLELGRAQIMHLSGKASPSSSDITSLIARGKQATQKQSKSHKSVSERKEAWKGCVLRKRRAAALSCLDRMSLEESGCDAATSLSTVTQNVLYDYIYKFSKLYEQVKALHFDLY